MGDRAIVSIAKDSERFDIYLPEAGSAAHLAEYLKSVRTRAKNCCFLPGEIAVDFICVANILVKPRLIIYSNAIDRLADCQLYLFYSPSLGDYEAILYPIVGGVTKKEVFGGPIPRFIEWAEKSTGWENLVSKVVTFKYNGGSRPGKNRTIRVEKVERSGNAVRIGGYDLLQKEFPWREYLSDRIVGEISVVSSDD